MKSDPKNNWYKLIYQITIAALLFYMGMRLWLDKSYIADFEAYCPFGGLQALGSFLTRDSLSCSMTTVQILMGLALMAVAIIFSKLFCGYICPIGTLSEYLGKIGEKLKIRFTITGIADLVLRSLKYVLLFITFYFTLKSSELFCKKFDPYYAVASGFDPDVTVLYAVITILIVIVGSVFLRLFWCKYLCPLGALTNIFRFSWLFAGVMIIYVILVAAGLKLSFVWPLAILCTAGFILEITRKKKTWPNFFVITRNTETCNDCNLCTERCPQGIDVAKMNRVTHIDCTLCGDCIHECPEKDTLQINRKNTRWLPALVLILFIAAAMLVSRFWELPTIDIRWGSPEQIDNAGVFQKSGLKNIKCFGSATTFSNQMRRHQGIYGVAAYVGTSSVKIFYDQKMYNDTTLQQLMFVPEKRVISTVGREVTELTGYRMLVENFFDPLDVTYLQHLLRQNSQAVGFTSEFGCPIIITVYFVPGTEPRPDDLERIFESKHLTFESNNNTFNVKLKYKVMSIEKLPAISRTQYAARMFSPLTMRFNGYANVEREELMEVSFPMDSNTAHRARYTHLVSHLSNDKGVLGFDNYLDNEGTETGRVIFRKDHTAPESIFSRMNADTLMIHYSDGRTVKVLNPFRFEEIREAEALKEINLYQN
ncbi:MAG: 4Fe-4S binding protein [Bacteroidales bacterium]